MAAWMAFDRIERIGEHRADHRTAMLLHQNAEIHRDPKKRSKPFEFKQFLPFPIEPPGDDLNAAQLKHKLIAAFKSKK